MADKNFGVKGIQFIGDPNVPTITIGSSTISYDGSLNLKASTVAIGTDVSIGGKVVSNVVVSNSYSVGIGTTILTEKLNVNGNVNISGIVTASKFYGDGTGLTGLVINALSGIDSGVYQYFLVSPEPSGSISSLSVTSNYIIFNPAAKYLGIGVDNPEANLDVLGTGKFSNSVISPSFTGTATTATNLENAANITTGIVSSSRLSGTYGIDITGNSGTATIASGLTTTININTTGIVTAYSFTGDLTGTATTAVGLTTTSNVNTSGIISASSFVGTLSGLASTAIQLQDTRYFNVSGDVSTGSSVAFNGTQNVGLAVTLALSGVSSGTYGSPTSIPAITVNEKGLITGVTTSGIVVGDGTLDLKTSGTGLSGIATFTANQATGTAVTFTVTSNATSDNTSNTIVSRDASGNFIAGIITATTFSGTATTADGLTTTSSVNTSGIITATTFSTGIATQTVGFTTGIISGPNITYINPYTIGVSTGIVRILGNLIVDGTTTTNTTQNVVTDTKTIGIAVSETDNIVLDGSGITIGSTSIQKTLLWNYGSLSLKSSENLNLALGKVYKINDNEVLSSTALANSVVTSGLTTVGTLKQLVVSNSSSTDLVRITQEGTGNAIVVEDTTNPDATPFIVNSVGSVGVGTTNPTEKIQVDGNILVSGIITASSFIGDLTGTATTATNLADAANITTGTISSSRLSGSYGISITGTATTATNLADAANITTGTISSSRLSGSYGISITGTATTANNVSSTININTSGIITATDFNSTSDINLKTNIHKIEDSLSKVIQIRGVTFNWKETNKSSAGVIAQEVQCVLPELVSGEETKTVNYNGIIGALIEAVKELKVENDILKEKLEEVYKKVFN
jgi:hypothetical protein